MLADVLEKLVKRLWVKSVVGIHDLIEQAAAKADALINTFSVPAVFVLESGNLVRILLFEAVC